jgi:nicotinamidase-related amidase
MKALILVDFENEWMDPRSEYYVSDLSQVLDNTNRLIDHCRPLGYKIIFTTHIEKGSAGPFAGNTKNVEIISSMHKKSPDMLIRKFKISPFYKTDLEKELKGVDEIVVAGILTNLCVRSLVQDAYDREFDITIISDCCIAMDKKTHEFTLKDLKETREEIKIMDLKEFLGSK